MPTLLIVDDHQLILDSLTLVYRNAGLDFTVYTAKSTAKALEHIKTTPIDLMLLDLCLDNEDGLDFLQQLKKSHRSVPCAILSASKNLAHAHQALNLGALGFIPKEHSGEQLIFATQHILAGEIYLPDSHQQLSQANTDFANTYGLTPRQVEIIHHLANGKSNQQIADTLNIALTTVKSHTGAIFQTCGVTSRLECVQKATQIGLISS